MADNNYIKTNLLFFILSITSCSCLAQQQMHVKLTDGTVHDYDVSNIEEVSFDEIIQDDDKAIIPYFHAVDLGLSVLWADMNIGAEFPEDFGNYYAWGETEPKELYVPSTYKWWDSSSKQYTKYNTPTIWGENGHIVTLEPEDDAAAVNWGGKWRMPSRDEFAELVDNCTWTNAGPTLKEGKLVTGPNGNSIFIPSAALRSGTVPQGAGGGYYHSNTLSADKTCAYDVEIYFHWSFAKIYIQSGYGRTAGLPIRPVCPK